MMGNLPWVNRQWGRGKEDSVGDNLAQGKGCDFACQYLIFPFHEARVPGTKLT